MDNSTTPSLEEFTTWRRPRYGLNNPTKIASELWHWMIENDLSAYDLNCKFGYEHQKQHDPSWSFERMGRTVTTLPDGREIYIGGEYEDSYDPDFNIYNDVIVKEANGEISVYCYPKESFPPTDFHTATLVEDKIVIIGCLGFHEDRQPGHTPVLLLDINTFKIIRPALQGAEPGWIHAHSAELNPDKRRIIITGGEIACDGDDVYIKENIEEWALDVSNFEWKQLTNRDWSRIHIKRKDNDWNHLWEYRQLKFDKRLEKKQVYESKFNELSESLKSEPNLELLECLYVPPVEHFSVAEEDDEYNVRKITVEDVIVRFVEESEFIQITFEGDLPSDTRSKIANHVSNILAQLENTEVVSVQF